MAEDLRTFIATIIDTLNQRKFDALAASLDEDAVLDMPGGSRVIGAGSLRNTLSEFLLRHDARFADSAVMTDDAGIRGAAEVTVHGSFGGEGGATSLPAVLIFERGEPGGKLVRISFHSAVID